MFLILCFNLFFIIANGHTWMLTPTPRLANLCMPVKNGNSNCCLPKPNSVNTVYTRGQIVSSSLGRNNHIGGFIQFSIVKLVDSDIPNIFNNDQNIFQYNCYASDCNGANNDFYAGDPNGTPFNGIKCNTKFQIPTWLDDGDYTIQWRWFAGGDSFGIRNLGLIDFVTCHDFKIQGGAKTSKPSCPLFIGGDANTPNLNTCEYFKDTKINTCTDEHNCFSWFAKSPPKKIIDCPSNIITLQDANNNNFKGRNLQLYTGKTNHKISNPDPNQQALIPNVNTISVAVTLPASTTKAVTNVKKLCICDSDIEQYCRSV